MSAFLEESWFRWALGIVVGFPLAVALLGQILGSFRRRELPVARSLWVVINVLLPIVAFFLILRFVVELPRESVGNRALLTSVLVLTILVSVSAFNAIFFGGAPKGSWRANTPKLLRDIILVLMVAVGGAVVLAQVWEQNVTGLLAALGVGSVILGFALQETLGNVMLGLSLLLERPFSEGDEILIGDTEGLVEEINWRATRLEVDGDIVTIPHSVAAGETIVNLSRPKHDTPVSVSIGFAYEHPPNRIRAMLNEALEETEGATVLPDKPELGVFVEEFGDSAVIYKITFLAAAAEVKERVIDRFMTLVWYAAQRSGFTIPFPIRTLYNFDGPSSAPDTRERAMAELGAASALGGAFEPEELDRWAQAAKLVHYSAGETVVRQGRQAAGLFILVAGDALLTVRTRDGRRHELYKLERGDFFGEMTVLSGADSPYAVTAETDLELLTLPSGDVQRVVEGRPSLAMEIGRIMDARRRAIAAVTMPTALGAAAGRDSRRSAKA